MYSCRCVVCDGGMVWVMIVWLVAAWSWVCRCAWWCWGVGCWADDWRGCCNGGLYGWVVNGGSVVVARRKKQQGTMSYKRRIMCQRLC